MTQITISGTMKVTYLPHYDCDPCDEWPVLIHEGRLCRIFTFDSGVSPFLGPRSDGSEVIGWRYEVVETSFIPYGVFRCYAVRPI